MGILFLGTRKAMALRQNNNENNLNVKKLLLSMAAEMVRPENVIILCHLCVPEMQYA